MGKCSNCKKKIQYNKFKRYRGKILCYDCYDTRQERKRQKKLEAEAKDKITADNVAATSKEFGMEKEEDDKAIAPEDALNEETVPEE